MSRPEDVLPGFRDALVEAGDRRIKHRARRAATVRRAAAAGGTALLLVAVVAGMTLAKPESAHAGVVITRSGEVWRVNASSSDVTAAQIESALEAEGILASVAAVPVGPSRVGEFIAGDSDVIPIGPDPESSRTIEIDANAASVHARFGRPARTGETYTTFSDAYGHNEPLECTDVYGVVAEKALPLIRREIANIELVTPSDSGARADYETLLVTDVLMVSADRAHVTLAPKVGSGLSASRGTDRCPVGP